MTVVAVLDYGSGNLHSVARALVAAGADVQVTAEPKLVLEADGLVVPGVGAFAACMDGLSAIGGPALVRERLAAGRPVLGVCVGQQIMFSAGVEHGREAAGLGFWPGRVTKLQARTLPHMGWNVVAAAEESVLFAGLAGERFYFVHSYAAHDGAAGLVSWATHGCDTFVAAVEDGPLTTTQFHPEKSGASGLQLLRNWIGSVTNSAAVAADYSMKEK